MSDSNGVEQVTQGVGQLSTSNGVKPGTVEGQSFKTKAKIVFKPSSAGDGGIGTNIFGTEKPDIKPSSNVNPNTNTEVAPVSWNKPAPVDAPISWDKPSVDVAPISWDKPSVDVAPISWDKPVAESAPVSWNKPVAEIAPISWDKPADTDAEINAVSWETPDSKPKEEPIYAKVNKSQIVPAGNGSASTSNEWVPSFNITDGTQLYLNETATPDMNFSPLNATTVVDDEDDANKVYKYDGSMVFDKNDLSEGGVKIDFSEKERAKNWDPTPLVRDMYCETQQLHELSEDITTTCRMEGYIEKLPVGQTKASLIKGWKRRYFRAKEGNLFYYEDNQKKKPLGFVQLMGSTVVDCLNKTLEIRDLNGRMILLKFGSTAELDDWKVALLAEGKEGDWKASSAPTKSLVIVDIGTCSVRAGLLPEGDGPITAPQIFFPTICAKNKHDPSKKLYGYEALSPHVRENSTISFPIRNSVKMDRLGLNLEATADILEKVFDELGIDPSRFTVVMVTHRNLGVEGKVKLADILFNHFNVAGIYIQEQSIFALYSYNTTTGIIVDAGEHVNVVPVVDGFVLEGGVSRLFYGGRDVTDHLNRMLTETGYKSYKYSTEIETFIPRFLKEKVCYVAEDYDAEMRKCSEDVGLCTASVDLEPYDLPDKNKVMKFDSARFRCSEGLFNPEMWGVDNIGLQKLVHKAVQTCSIDVRKQMCRSIYLSGGVTLTPGFAERLQAELVKLFPKTLVIQVHAAAERYHSAYLGACILASLNAFTNMCISREEYTKRGPACVSKWEIR